LSNKTQQQQEEEKKETQGHGHKFYDRFYFCDYCTSWIPKEEAVMVKKKIRKFPTCPKASCNNNRLKTQSTNYKYKSKDDAERRSKREY
jgi:hypothetical protein